MLGKGRCSLGEGSCTQGRRVVVGGVGGSVKSGYSRAEVFWPVSSSGQGDGQGKTTQCAPVTPTIPRAYALQLALKHFPCSY